MTSRFSESKMQQAFIAYCRLNEPMMPALKLAFAVPNQGKRTRSNANRMLAEGLRAGVPDWILPIHQGPYSGLAIEFKNADGKVSIAQKEYHELMRAYGWRVEVCYKWEYAIPIVRDYLRYVSNPTKRGESNES